MERPSQLSFKLIFNMFDSPIISSLWRGAVTQAALLEGTFLKVAQASFHQECNCTSGRQLFTVTVGQGAE